MRQRQKMVALVLTVSLILAGAGMLWNANSRAVLAGVENTLGGELSKSLGTSIDIGSMEVVSWNAIALRDTIIYDKQGRKMIASDTVTATFNLLDLLRGKPVVEALTTVQVIAPEVFLLRDGAGRWNVADLVQDRPQGAAFAGRVAVEGGIVSISVPEGQWTLHGIHGGLDFAQNPTVELSFAGTQAGTAFQVNGVCSAERGGLEITADRALFQEYSALLPQTGGFRLTAGEAKEIALSLQWEKNAVTYAGEARFYRVTGGLDRFPLEDASGMVTFTEKAVHFFAAEARVAGQPVQISGELGINGAEPAFNLSVSSPACEIQALTDQIPVRGPVAFTAALTGTLSRPLVDGQFTLAQGEIADYPVSDATAHLQVAMSSEGARPAELVINGTVEISAGQISGIPFTGLKTGFYVNGSQATVHYLTTAVGAGHVSARGTLIDNTLQMEVWGQDVSLAALANSAPGLLLDGRASFTGTLTGAINNPEFQATFSAADGQVFFQPYHEATGELQITHTTTTIRNTRLTDGPTSHEVAGTIGLTGDRLVNLTITSRQARAENIVKLLAPGEKLTGNVDNTVALSGPLANFDANGQVTLTDGSFRGYLIPRATGVYQRQQGITKISEVIINSIDVQAKLSGQIAADGGLDFSIEAKEIDLAKLPDTFPYPAAGMVSFNGRLAGTTADPRLEGVFAAPRMTLNGQELEAATATMSIDREGIDIPHFGFQQGPGRFTFVGGMSWGTKEMNGALDVENGQLAPLLKALNVKLSGIDGKLNGRITLQGTSDNPTIAISGGLSAGNIKNYPLDNIEVDAVLENNVLTVNQLLAKQGNGILAVKGTADLAGPLNMEVGGRDIDAGLLTTWTDSSLAIKGKLGFAAQISGTAKAPHAAVSLEIQDGSVANATFDKLYGLFILDNNNIEISQLLLSKGPYRASAYGSIPLAALNAQGRSQASAADQMAITLRLDQADLSILPLLTQEVSWAVGPTRGEVTIGGTLAQPEFRGNISIVDGTVKLKSLADPIQKVALDIQLEGDTIKVKSLTGHMGSGLFRFAGSAVLSGQSLSDYNLELTLDKLGINHKYFKGPVSGSLHLADANGIPLLSGKVAFENDTVNIPFIPELTASNLNLGLNVELAATPRVHFYNPYMYDIWAEGGIKVTGSTQSPLISGGLKSVRGTVSYLRTQFRVRYASVQFLHPGVFEPTVKLVAESSLAQTKVNLNVSGPATALNIRLTSDPAMSQQEILSLLTLRGRYLDRASNLGGSHDTSLGRDEVMGLLGTGLQMSFINDMERSLRGALGLDEFRLVSGSLSLDGKNSIDAYSTNSNQELYNLQIGKYVTDRLFLSYTKGVNRAEYNIAFRYDITRRIGFTGVMDQQNRSRYGLEARFSF